MVALMLPCATLAEFHVFTVPDGRALEARVASYDAVSEKVVLERQDGKRVKVSPSSFVEDDQRYIQDWIAVNTFLSDRTLKIKCDDRVVKQWKEEESTDVTYDSGRTEEDFVYNIIKYETVVYDFTLENTSDRAVQNLVLEYCVYYEQSGMTWEKRPETELKTFYGTINIARLPIGEPVAVSTKPVMVYEDSINPIPQAGGDLRRPGRGEIVGILARLVLKKDDLEVTRELTGPKSMNPEKYPWVKKSDPNVRKPFKDLFGNRARRDNS